MKLKKYTQYLPYIIFIVALLSTLISLSLSEIFHYTPCILCWYQRICMYPLVVISAVAILRKRLSDLPYYILPLSILGFLIALYHNFLVWGILPEAVAPCTTGVSCLHPPAFFGFITVPLGSMISFAGITLFVLLYAKMEKEKPTKVIHDNSHVNKNIKTVKRITR